MTNQKTVARQRKHSGALGFWLPMVTQNPLDVSDGAGGGELVFVLRWAVPRKKDTASLQDDSVWSPVGMSWVTRGNP